MSIKYYLFPFITKLRSIGWRRQLSTPRPRSTVLRCHELLRSTKLVKTSENYIEHMSQSKLVKFIILRCSGRFKWIKSVLDCYMEKCCTENREFNSFEPGMNLDGWLVKTVIAQTASSVAGIYVLWRHSNFWHLREKVSTFVALTLAHLWNLFSFSHELIENISLAQALYVLSSISVLTI